jgi:hypothetical protein
LVSSICSCSLSFGHCIAFLSLIYGFWLPLWYLQTALVLFLLVIVLPFFLWFTASDYPFGIFKLPLFSFFWSLYCLSFFDLQLLITSLVSSIRSCSLSFGHCIAFLSLIYSFWLPLWYLQTGLVLFLLVIVLPEDTKGVIRSRKSKKERQYNDQKKENKRSLKIPKR